MAGYKWDKFGGLRPISSRLRLGDASEAFSAENVDLHRGFLRPRDTQTAWNGSLHPSLLVTTDVVSGFSITAGTGTSGPGFRLASSYNPPGSGPAVYGSVTPDPTLVGGRRLVAFTFDTGGGANWYRLAFENAALTAPVFDRIEFVGDNELTTILRVSEVTFVQNSFTYNMHWQLPPSQLSSGNTYEVRAFTTNLALAEPQTLFRFLDRVDNDQFWMYWTTDVDVAAGNVENPEQRHYYTGDGAPKMFTADSIDAVDTPYPEPVDTKYPFVWFFLGVPAPAAAPTIDGESYVPPDTAKSGVITGCHVPNVIIRFNPARGHRGADIIRSNTNGESTEVSGETHMDSDAGAMVMKVMENGTRVKVTEIVDGDQVRVVGTVGTGCFEQFGGNYDDPTPDNRMDERWTWDEDEIATLPFEDISFSKKLYRKINGKKNDIVWSYHVPDGAVLQIASHSLKVGDIIRVVSAATPMTWSTPTRMRAGPPLVAGVNDRQRPVFDPGEVTIEFEGELTYFIERDGREFDPTIEDVVVDAREPTTRSYVYTYVTSFGEEGPPSAPTDPFTLALGDSVVVEGFTAPPTEHRDITTYRLYRTNTGSQDTAFQFVADIPIAETDYEDALADDELGEVLQSETWEPPPADMIGICAMPNQFLAGFFDNVLCFSEPGFPHAWPVEYRMHLEHKIIAIKVIGGTLIVATRGVPYVVAGTHPRQMAARKETEPAPCVDKRSLVDCGDVAVYASTDGLVAASPAGFRTITLEYYSREQWVNDVVGPASFDLTRTVRAWHKDGEYILFTTFEDDVSTRGQARVFDLRNPRDLRITEPGIAMPQAAFTDPTNGELYYVPSEDTVDALTYETELPDSNLPILRWRYLYPPGPPDPYDPLSDGNYAFYRSGILMLPRPMSISVVQVICRRVTTTYGTEQSFGNLKLSLVGFRYDASNTASIDREVFHSTELCFEVLLSGDINANDFLGDHGSRPFRVNQNVLVDALSFDFTMRGYVEVEALLVGESYDDLVRLAVA